MKTAVIAAWLLVEAAKMPLSHAPGETPDQLHARLEVSTNSLAIAAKDQADGTGWTSTELAAWGLVLWHGETLLDARIHAGLPHPIWTQDKGMAHCFGQIHPSALIPPERWAKLTGTDEEATLQCARATLLVAVAQGRRCGTYIGVRASRDRVAQVFAAYGSGGKCKPDDRAWQRADRWLKVMASRPDKSPEKGYRRVLPMEIPRSVREEARMLIAQTEHPAVNYSKPAVTDSRFRLRVERHAEGKVGVSVLVRE